MKTIFDDFVLEERYGQQYIWTQVCEEHAELYAELGSLDAVKMYSICGVLNCSKQADYYLDIYQENFINEK